MRGRFAAAREGLGIVTGAVVGIALAVGLLPVIIPTWLAFKLLDTLSPR